MTNTVPALKFGGANADALQGYVVDKAYEIGVSPQRVVADLNAITPGQIKQYKQQIATVSPFEKVVQQFAGSPSVKNFISDPECLEKLVSALHMAYDGHCTTRPPNEDRGNMGVIAIVVGVKMDGIHFRPESGQLILGEMLVNELMGPKSLGNWEKLVVGLGHALSVTHAFARDPLLYTLKDAFSPVSGETVSQSSHPLAEDARSSQLAAAQHYKEDALNATKPWQLVQRYRLNREIRALEEESVKGVMSDFFEGMTGRRGGFQEMLTGAGDTAPPNMFEMLKNAWIQHHQGQDKEVGR